MYGGGVFGVRGNTVNRFKNRGGPLVIHFSVFSLNFFHNTRVYSHILPKNSFIYKCRIRADFMLRRRERWVGGGGGGGGGVYRRRRRRRSVQEEEEEECTGGGGGGVYRRRRRSGGGGRWRLMARDRDNNDAPARWQTCVCARARARIIHSKSLRCWLKCRSYNTWL